MDEIYERLVLLAKAGANVLHLASFEWERIQGLMIGLSSELELPLWVWSSSSGLKRRNEAELLEVEDENLGDPIEAMLTLRESKDGGILLLEDIHPFLEPQHHQVTRWVRELCRISANPRRLLVLSTPLPELPIELSKEVPTIELTLPDVEALSKVREYVTEELDCTFDSENDALLEAARGLTVMEAKLAFGQAAIELGHLGAQAVSFVIREKERVIKQSGVLEYYEPDASMVDVGGLEHLKTWLSRRGHAFGPGARRFGLDSPKGVLLLGVQGCGKSLIAKAIASSWQFPLLRLDMGKVFGGIVGQSEGNIRTALQVAQALAPCVLWIDEIEKGLAGMGSSDLSDAGTTARVVGTFLTWMQEKREPVFVTATANQIDLLPPELLRKGRFDEIFFVDLPTQTIREEILAIHLKKKERKPEEFDLEKLARLSIGFSGAELEEAIREGLFNAFAEGVELQTQHIIDAIEVTYPLSRTMREQIKSLRIWAKVRARLASHEDPEELPKDTTEDIPKLRQETRNLFVPGKKS
ncbi:MAG: AAA family ATPase [Deltaproteobacteria bacterium]|nr:MAG: AAA family ATPase [Deltaproteobacteria bacterium]